MIFANVKSATISDGKVVSISKGSEVLWKKHKYKRELLYLESAGKQYIDTGVIGKSGIKSFLDFEFISGDLNDFIVLGSANNKWAVRFYPVSVRDGSMWTLGYGGRLISTTSATLKQRYKVESELLSGKQTMNVDGSIVINSADIATIKTTRNMFLFGVNGNGAFQGYGGVRIYSCWIEVDGTLVRDFIPVLDMNDVPCMYDKVSGEFFYNKGTGQFTYG